MTEIYKMGFPKKIIHNPLGEDFDVCSREALTSKNLQHRVINVLLITLNIIYILFWCTLDACRLQATTKNWHWYHFQLMGQPRG